MAERLLWCEGGVAGEFQQSWSIRVAVWCMGVGNVAVLYFGIGGVRDSLLRLKVVVTRTTALRAESPQVGVDLDG